MTRDPAEENRAKALRQDALREGGKTVIFHEDDVEWADAPLPPRFHRCKPQTSGILEHSMNLVERCACGAIRITFPGQRKPYWAEKNSRRKFEREEKRANSTSQS